MGYGIATKQGTNYALMVMIVLAAVVAIFGGIEIDRSVDCITKGVASQANMFLIFVSIDVLLNLVTLGGGFDALSNLLTYGSNGNQVTAKDQAAAKASYAALQQEIMADYADMKAAVAAADTLEAKQAAATNASNAMSQKVYNTTLKMYNKLQAKTAARAWVSSLLH